MQAVKEFNYQSKAFAKGLKEGKSNTVGLIGPNIRDLVFPAAIRGISPISDQDLDALQDKDTYVTAALLAKEAGFDGVNIKFCHRYLCSQESKNKVKPSGKCRRAFY
jgi:hypothetical protein